MKSRKTCREITAEYMQYLLYILFAYAAIVPHSMDWLLNLL